MKFCLKMITKKLSEIKCEDRLRVELGDIEELADSIQAHGLIQPILLDEKNAVIAGGRRFTAYTLIAQRTESDPEVPVVYRKDATKGQKLILELEENLQRKDMEWQENVRGIARIHSLKLQSEGSKWMQSATGKLLGMSQSNVSNVLLVAPLLDKDPEINAARSLRDALSMLRTRKLRAIQAEQVRRLRAAQADDVSVYLAQIGDLTGTEPEGIEEEFWVVGEDSAEQTGEAEEADKSGASVVVAPAPAKKSLLLEPVLLLESGGPNSLEQFKKIPMVDAIITDPPYGIDMDMLTQSGAFEKVNLDIKDSHQVEDNLEMLAEFVRVAAQKTDVLIMFCDAMNFRFLVDRSAEAGFRPTRWPFTWVKHNCLNQAPYKNMGKATEIALIATKPGWTSRKPLPLNNVFCGARPIHRYLEGSEHPFCKPAQVWEYLAKAYLSSGDTVCDPFAGVGSSVLSFLDLDLNVIAIEQSEAWYNELVLNTKKRWQKESGVPPTAVDSSGTL